MIRLEQKAFAVLGACIALGAFSAASQAALMYQNAPLLGTNVVNNGNGSLTVTTDAGPITIPTTTTIPNPTPVTYSQFNFPLSATACCSAGNPFDPTLAVYAASAVVVDPAGTYSYNLHWEFLGEGPNPAYAIDQNFTWTPSPFNIAEHFASLTEFWDIDAGNWRYTETWTGLAGADAGASISFTRAFCLDDGSVACINPAAVPEPVSLALLGIGLAGLGFSRRRID